MSSSTGKLLFYGRNLARKSPSVHNYFSPVTAANSVFYSNSNCAKSTRFFSSSSPPPPLPGDSSKEPFIPAYQQRQGESLVNLKARLLYQSRKRGMLENGLLLSTFAAKFLNSMSEGELKEYDRLINLPSNDWDIYYWATGVKPIPKEFDTAILHKFIEHVRNADRESRIRQPDL